MERSMRAQVQAAPQDQQLRKDYEAYKRDQLEFELHEYQQWAEAYPSDLTLRFEAAARLFALGRFDQAIPVLQQARQDPKIRVDATITLGRAFLEAGFVDEAVETLQGVIDDYPLKDDDRAKLMMYWQGRAFEEKNVSDQALKRYSQVAQAEFTYKDVQQRIKKLRAR
jgi:tetratricopeptide (TPR) repeat protein